VEPCSENSLCVGGSTSVSTTSAGATPFTPVDPCGAACAGKSFGDHKTKSSASRFRPRYRGTPRFLLRSNLVSAFNFDLPSRGQLVEIRFKLGALVGEKFKPCPVAPTTRLQSLRSLRI